MAGFLRRGVRLARTNPRIFLLRLGMIGRRPVRNTRALMSIARRRETVETAYAAWRSASISRDEALPTDAGPTLSVIMPVYNVDRDLLVEAIESVRGQSYARWELCIADDASTEAHVRQVLEHYAALDRRIRIRFRHTTGHIAAASNTALEEATGDFVVLLDHDDLLAPRALQHVAEVIVDCPTVDFIYSDEDKIDPAGAHCDPFFKPAWSPTLLTSCNYITHLAAIRRTLVAELGGFRTETVGSQDHDLFLRVAEVARCVAHIPRVLYSWRMAPGSTALASSSKPYAVAAARRALDDSVARRGLHAEVRETHLNGIFVLRHSLQPVQASVVVRGSGSEWQQILDVEGLHIRDVLHLDPSTGERGTWATSKDISALRGEYLIWIDSGSRPATPESVRALLEQLQSPGARIAGGMTVDADAVLQAGLVVGAGGQPMFAGAGLPLLPHRHMYLNLKDLPHEVAAVWIGCAATRRDPWAELGGWNDFLPPDLAMVDLCLRADRAGHRVVYTPLARFRRGTQLPPLKSVRTVDWPWRDTLDPVYSPNLDPSSPDGLPFLHGENRVSVRPGGGAG